MRRLDAQPVMAQQTLIGRKNGPMGNFLLTKLKNTADSLKLNNKLPQQEEKKVEIIKLDEFLENIKKFQNKENKENQENKEIFDNKENEENSSKLLLASKKIQKTPTMAPTVNISAARKALEDLTTLCKNKAALDAQRKPVITKPFAEDIQKQTRNYVALTYLNRRSKKKEQFYCFHDRDLKVPTTHSGRTIHHSCDNDCTTDEEQIKGAIKNLYRVIENQVNEEKKYCSLALPPLDYDE